MFGPSETDNLLIDLRPLDRSYKYKKYFFHCK